ncbi:DNA topoisomerase I [Mycoplasma haemofelis str. Langford 1]|uniref:DNA topoisomerase 1 n=1 Tax=Mycoplasma haemofelis (strain Langford 1) TaxID=941640 RepID=E8ZK73_MYCHL|nr:type I DNA topoisomerase [Mycoplasma haemofelis]CBY93544.1 DNA topoisomerase I [Mycoplasma haemofelis str. Langford 1]
MKHDLMLIESPNKIATISKYLKGTNIKVIATIGHFREIDGRYYKPLGFDLETYDVKWKNDSEKVVKGKKIDIIKEINKAADASENIYLSTDPDREGEAISWHIFSILSEKNRKKCQRVVFNEITKRAIEQSLLNPRQLDQNQINSYLTRKLLDRCIGFKLSDFTHKTIGGQSAGRVQSIALKFLKDKDREIKSFVPEHWFNLKIFLDNGLELTLKEVSPEFKVDLHPTLKNGFVNFLKEEDAKLVEQSLLKDYKLVSIDDPKREITKPPKAFKTSTMQEKAINKLGMSSSVVERTAQRLYEGVQIDGETLALITYPRTDREDLSLTFVEEAKSFILGNYSEVYWGSQRVIKKGNNDSLVQGAHEGIRPTDINITPDSIRGKIPPNELKLYTLIWTYAVASLMADAVYENTLYKFENNRHKLTANCRVEKFDGFKILFRKFFPNSDDGDPSFPSNLEINKSYSEGNKEMKKVDKKPPSPYTEASLIKSLDSEGIGRPSTYSHIVNIVLQREYAVRKEGKLIVTEFGSSVADALEKYFPDIMKYDYTRNMEKELDNISENKTEWKSFLKDTFGSFFEVLKVANEKAFKESMLGRQCPKCQSELCHRYSKNGNKFISCSAYPKCDYIENVKEEGTLLDEECPECHSKLERKKSKSNSEFVGCSNYPKCKYIKRDVEVLDKKCPNCDHDLVKKKNRWGSFFVSCSNYPKCKYIESSNEELNEACPECKRPLVKKRARFKKSFFISCSNYPTCKYSRSLKGNDDK